jgi:hypothetical protein
MSRFAFPSRILALGIFLFLAGVMVLAAVRADAQSPGSNNPPKAAASTATASNAGDARDVRLNKAFISFRVGVTLWQPENRYRELLALFEKYKGVTDEITFFTSCTHPPLPLEVMKQRCELLKQRMEQARTLGYRAGINVLSTIGHHEENLANSLSGDYTCVTDINGSVSHGSFCPNDPRLQEYIREVYRSVAKANPDYIWIDDDVRLAGHMPVGVTCFCDNCLSIFEKESGVKYTRATFREAVNGGTPEQRLAVRKAWLAHNRATISRLFSLIEQTVHEVKPDMPLGFMTGDRFFEGYDFDHWAEVLAGPKHAPVYWRPGGGYYEDTSTGGLVGKSNDIGRQVSMLPPWVESIQSEIENFPYQRLKKAAHITTVEAASHMGAGCTGAAFNVLSMNDEPLDEFEPLVARIRRARPFYDLMAKYQGRMQPIGLFAAWSKETAVASDFPGGDWCSSWAGGYLGTAAQLLESGLPTAYSPQDASVTLLFRESVAAMSKEEITKVLSSGVYMDAETLDMLNKQGFQELTGLSVEKTLPIDCIEEFTQHPLNGTFAGRQRDARQSFWHVPGYLLKPVDPKAQTLARLVDYGGKEMAATSMAVYENRLGGRVCVCGYYPWTFLHSLSKTAQMKSVMRWLSREKLPAYVASYHKVNLWARQRPTEGAADGSANGGAEGSAGGLAIALLNASFDPAEQLTLALLTTADTVRVFDMDGNEQTIRAGEGDGPYRHFVLPSVEAWSMRLVVVGR